MVLIGKGNILMIVNVKLIKVNNCFSEFERVDILSFCGEWRLVDYECVFIY